MVNVYVKFEVTWLGRLCGNTEKLKVWQTNRWTDKNIAVAHKSVAELQ